MQFVFKPNSIITLVGPTHAGKSSFSKQMKEQLEAQGKSVVILSSDAIRRELLNVDVNANVRHNKAFCVSKQAFDILKTQLNAYVSYPVNFDYVIVDTTGLSEDFRKSILEVSKAHNYGSYLMVFDLPSKTVLSRTTDAAMQNVIMRQIDVLKKKVFPSLDRKSYLSTYTIRKELNGNFEALSISNADVKIHTITDESDLTSVYIIGDIHECVSELSTLINDIKTQSIDEKYEIYLDGDWIDKGHNTKGMIDYLTTLVNDPELKVHLIRGNHENYVYRKLKDSSYVYTLNDETKHFSSLPTFLADPQLQESFFNLYENSISYLHVDKSNVQAYVTHSCAKSKYLGKTDPTSLKNIYKQNLNWDTPILDQVGYIFEEASFNAPYHIFGHIVVDKSRHVYKNMISIDQGCVEGGHLTACKINLNATEKHLSFLAVPSTSGTALPEEIKNFNYILDKNVGTKSYDNLDHVTVRKIKRLIKQKNIYMSPTMAPAPSWYDTEKDCYDLETVASSIRYLLGKDVTEVIAQKKHMGSRCQTYIYPNLEDCYAVSRNGWRVKESEWLTKALTKQWNEYKDKILSDYLVFDNELLPWSALGQGLIDHDFSAYHEAIADELNVLKDFGFEQYDPNLTTDLEHISKFKTQLDIYGKVEEPYLEPFGVIYNGASLLEEDLTLLLPAYNIPFEYFNLTIPESVERLHKFYEDQTLNGCTEGIVIKPAIWNKKSPPYMKIRNPEYLRLVYGFNYQTNLKKLVIGKNISGKVATSTKEQNLNVKLIANKDDPKALFTIYADILNEFEKEKSLDPRL